MIRVGYQKMRQEILVLNFEDGARHWKVSLSEVEQCVWPVNSGSSRASSSAQVNRGTVLWWISQLPEYLVSPRHFIDILCLKYMSSCVFGYGLRRQHLCKHVSSCFCSLTKDEKQRPKYAKLLVSIRFLVYLHYKAPKLAITIPKFKRKVIMILFFIWNIISDTVIKTSFANLKIVPLCCRSIPLSNDIVNWKLTLPVMWWKFSITCERQTQTCRSSLPPTLDKAGLLLRAFNSGTT